MAFVMEHLCSPRSIEYGRKLDTSYVTHVCVSIATNEFVTYVHVHDLGDITCGGTLLSSCMHVGFGARTTYNIHLLTPFPFFWCVLVVHV